MINILQCIEENILRWTNVCFFIRIVNENETIDQYFVFLFRSINIVEWNIIEKNKKNEAIARIWGLFWCTVIFSYGYSIENGVREVGPCETVFGVLKKKNRGCPKSVWYCLQPTRTYYFNVPIKYSPQIFLLEYHCRARANKCVLVSCLTYCIVFLKILGARECPEMYVYIGWYVL